MHEPELGELLRPDPPRRPRVARLEPGEPAEVAELRPGTPRASRSTSAPPGTARRSTPRRRRTRPCRRRRPDRPRRGTRKLACTRPRTWSRSSRNSHGVGRGARRRAAPVVGCTNSGGGHCIRAHVSAAFLAVAAVTRSSSHPGSRYSTSESENPAKRPGLCSTQWSSHSACLRPSGATSSRSHPRSSNPRSISSDPSEEPPSPTTRSKSRPA